ncbi:MAG: DUF2585 family protein [Candidatus Rifleibacteriota bacterium]
MFLTDRKTSIRAVILIILIIISTIIVLRIMGRSWLAPDGSLQLWYGSANGPQTSQHLLDPYSFTHFLHGFIFYWILIYFKPKLSLAWCLLYAVAFESAWEITENSQAVIDYYRLATFAQGYYGDSIINSLSDIAICLVGFIIARKISIKTSIIIFLAIEIALIFLIRDSLMVNVLMVIYPSAILKNWQLSTWSLVI